MINYKVIGDEAFELVETIQFKYFERSFIVRQHEEVFLYQGIKDVIHTIDDLNKAYDEVNSDTFIEDDVKSDRLELISLAISIMRKHNRNVVIDKLVEGKERRNIKGLSPLVFAC